MRDDGLHEPIACVVPQGLRLQAVRQSAMRRWAVRGTSSRQQNRRRRADRALVREQDVVGTAAIAEMLVDVYNRLAGRRLRARGDAQQRERGAGQEIPAFHRGYSATV